MAKNPVENKHTVRLRWKKFKVYFETANIKKLIDWANIVSLNQNIWPK